MSVRERQKFITKILEKAIDQKAETNAQFDWFINSHSEIHFGKHFNKIHKIFCALGGNIAANNNKRESHLKCDAYFGGKYNLIFEFDEFQHFSSARYMTLNNYPRDLKTNFSVSDWKKNCLENINKADRYRYSKTTTDFNFEGGRTRQRAYLDCFRDLLPGQNNLNPTLRISEFEVYDIIYDDKLSQRKIREIVERKIRNLASL